MMEIVITNIDAVRRMDNELLAWSPDVVILDEAHRCGNPSSQQSKAMRKISKFAKRIALTGTPNSGDFKTVHGIYKWLDPTIFGTQTNFRARYFNTVNIGGNYDIVLGPKEDMLPELLDKMHSIAHTATKEEALDLPPIVDLVRYCDLESKAMKSYASMKKEALTLLDSGEVSIAQNVLTRLLRLSQITGGFLEDEAVSDAKAKLFTETITDVLEEQEKVIVFARFTAEIDAITEALGAAKISHTVIDGRVKTGDRAEAIRSFQEDFDPRVIIIQTQTGGEGITLTRASCVIFYSLSWSLREWEQARGRPHRIGQDKTVTYITLCANNTIDGEILKRLQEKRDVSRMSTFEWRKMLS